MQHMEHLFHPRVKDIVHVVVEGQKVADANLS